MFALNRFALNRLLLIVINLLNSYLLFGQDPVYEWAIMAGDTSSAFNTMYVTGNATDSQGNIYTAGYFWDTVDFDPGPGFQFVNSIGKTDSYIQKLDGNGNFLWVKTIEGESWNYVEAIFIDDQDNVYVGGTSRDTVDFDPGLGVQIFNGTSAGDGFILKLDSNGDFDWVKNFESGGQTVRFWTLYVANDGTIYSSGDFGQTVDFDPGAGVSNLSGVPGPGPGDCFVLKLDNNGSFIWVKQIAGNWNDFGEDIVVSDDCESVFLTGMFQATADFDPGPSVYNLTSVGSFDAFVMGLDSSGNFQWAHSYGESEYDIGRSLAIDSINNLYLAGAFAGTVDFDPGVGTTSLTGVGIRDVFIQKLDQNGNLLWVKQVSSDSGWVFGYSIDLDTDFNLYLTGFFDDSVDFDPGAGLVKLAPVGSRDVFVLSLNSNGDFNWAESIGSSSSDEGKHLAVFEHCVHVAGIFKDTLQFASSSGIADMPTNGITDHMFSSKLCLCGATYDTINHADCDSYMFPINGVTYTASGTYLDTLVNLAGCDSVVSLNLTISYSANTFSFDTILSSDSIYLEGSWQNSSGSYTDSLLSGAGCDSIHVTNLTVDTLIITGISAANTDVLHIFPNPANQIINFELEQAVTEFRVEVYDVQGVQMKVPRIADTIIDVSSLACGAYSLFIQSKRGERLCTRVFVIDR